MTSGAPGLRPLFPPTRVLSPDAQAVERDLEKLRATTRDATERRRRRLCALRTRLEARLRSRAQNDVVEAVGPALDELRRRADVLADRYASDVWELALSLCRQLMRREWSESGDSIRATVDEALRAVHPVGATVVRLHPDAFALWSARDASPDSPITVVADPELGELDVVVEDERGPWQAGLDVRLEELRRGYETGQAR